MHKKVSYRTLDGQHLVGIFSIPKAPRAFVLMMHGITETKGEYRDFYVRMADVLYSKGIASFRFDFRGHGESSGSSLDVSIIGEVLDIKASIAQIRRYWKRKISFVATSFGAGPTLIVATQRPSEIRSIILIAPLIDYTKTFLEPTTPWAKASFNSKAFRKLQKTGYLVLDNWFKLGTRLIEEFEVVKPYLLLKELKTPTLIIHGDKDSMVPYGVSLKWAKSNRSIKFVTLKNADHGYPDYREPEGEGRRSLANLERIITEVTNFVQ